MKILSIGNSFSQDAHRYLHAVAKGYGKEMLAANLYIGGCSLQTHYDNMQSGESAYDLEINGESTGEKISLSEALQKEAWDVVTLQQCSPLSGKVSTYTPYLQSLAAKIREICPLAKLYMHQTWAYEEGCEMLKNTAGFTTAIEMAYAVKNAYNLAAKKINADGIIPCGKGMFYLAQKGIKAHRDNFHASLGVGRYLLSLIWYGALTGEPIEENPFDGFDEEVSSIEKMLAVAAAQYALKDGYVW
ncbi:MAG: DUF4886 domain-containing protein [Clostridia bacterium]|nr:DUF4886 domain-containing protein [Clostridia bacterium]